MKFILGLLTGLVLGAVGAVAYSIQSGRDLRDAVEQVRAELDDRDLDALGARLEARFGQMQAQLEERISQARAKAGAGIDQASDSAHDAVDDASDAAKKAVDRAADSAEEAT